MTLSRVGSGAGTVAAVLRELHARNRMLVTVAAVNAVLAVCFTALMALDGRMLLGRNVWAKPWKFATSITIFTATIAWLLPSLSLSARDERLVSSVIGGAMLIEITLISTQAARGVMSHFNSSTPLDTAIFVTMGVTISISSAAVAYVLFRIIRDPPGLSPAYLRGIQMGIVVFLLASLQGGLMISYGGHSVGVAAGSAGLPLLNWHVSGGDLRIAHFVGLHGLQVLPFVGYVAAQSPHLSPRDSVLATDTAGLLYGGVTLATFVQALLGHPLITAGIVPSMAPVVVASLAVAGTICGVAMLSGVVSFSRSAGG